MIDSKCWAYCPFVNKKFLIYDGGGGGVQSTTNQNLIDASWSIKIQFLSLQSESTSRAMKKSRQWCVIFDEPYNMVHIVYMI